MEIWKITKEDDRYPLILGTIDDPPEELWYVGNLALLQRSCVGVVGSRKATEYGIRTARKIGRTLGDSGITTVSGLAYGIDMAAHQGALSTKGSTIAVLGSGIDMERSKYKQGIFRDILKGGLVISEYPPGYPASRYTFPRRNRIISGLSVATCVVEAGFSSGSLITAELAMEQGRCVYAVPGNMDSPASLGTNKLIRDGAVPLVTAGDIVSDMGVSLFQEGNLGTDEKLIMQSLPGNREVTLDEIAKRTGMHRDKAMGIISVLEMKGYLCTSMGKIFVTVS